MSKGKPSSGKGKTIKKKEISGQDRMKHSMRMVTSETCVVCKRQCERGIRYMESMSHPGALGYGVPCILTKGKG